MTVRNRAFVGLMIIVALALTAIPLIYELPGNTFLWIEIQNSGHTPIFGIIALLLLGISLNLLGSHLKQRWHHYLVALAGASLLGMITEFAQLNGPRDADIGDLIRDVAGAVSFLGVYLYFDKHLRNKRYPVIGSLRKTALLLAVVTLAGALVPLTLSSTVYLQRNSAFPVICDFDSYWGKRFLTTESARLKIVSPPMAMTAAREKVGELTLREGKYPGFGILEPYPDWGVYETLQLDIYSPLDTLVDIHIRVEDLRHDGNFADRFNRTLSIVPGENHISISLLDIRVAPRGREMDMSAIAAIHFFAVDLRQRLTLYFDNVHLQ